MPSKMEKSGSSKCVMRRLIKMRILAFDPSGNFEEGKGTTGWAFKTEGTSKLGEIRAKDFKRVEEYWHEHLKIIRRWNPTHVVIEGYRLYNHRGQAASSQANSTLETPQLIGLIKYYCWVMGIELIVQYATQVKSRWSDKVLQNMGILDSKNRFDGKVTNNHKRDALRHLLHFERYGKK